ncbi:MAG: CAP domain-containing protein [Anaerolineales bacterium]
MLRAVTTCVLVACLGVACDVNPLTPTALPEAMLAVQTTRPTRTPTVTPTTTATPTQTPVPSATLTAVPGSGALASAAPQATVAKQPLAGMQAVAPTSAPASADVAQRMIDLINSHRAAVGLGPLARDEGLMGIAQARADDMAARGYLGHDDPATGAPLARELLRAAGYTSAFLGENWYASGKTMPGAVDHAMAWFMGDAPHRANILSPKFVSAGVGIAFKGELWVMVQNFAGANQ